METPEQQYAREAAVRPHRPAVEPEQLSNQEWRQMDGYEQAAYLSRCDGDETAARKHEEARAELITPKPRKRGWFR
ncbi:hypothetical protein ACIPC1_13515 [Streptomyces sp. NPDC087263]|uniref:hypothetical protein n=1 Tax=Streptomyces sp. NPDC087263 TaxID=3365773 RepID=UPI003829A849